MQHQAFSSFAQGSDHGGWMSPSPNTTSSNHTCKPLQEIHRLHRCRPDIFLFILPSATDLHVHPETWYFASSWCHFERLHARISCSQCRHMNTWCLWGSGLRLDLRKNPEIEARQSNWNASRRGWCAPTSVWKAGGKSSSNAFKCISAVSFTCHIEILVSMIKFLSDKPSYAFCYVALWCRLTCSVCGCHHQLTAPAATLVSQTGCCHTETVWRDVNGSLVNKANCGIRSPPQSVSKPDLIHSPFFRPSFCSGGRWSLLEDHPLKLPQLVPWQPRAPWNIKHQN